MVLAARAVTVVLAVVVVRGLVVELAGPAVRWARAARVVSVVPVVVVGLGGVRCRWLMAVLAVTAALVVWVVPVALRVSVRVWWSVGLVAVVGWVGLPVMVLVVSLALMAPNRPAMVVPAGPAGQVVAAVTVVPAALGGPVAAGVPAARSGYRDKGVLVVAAVWAVWVAPGLTPRV